MSIRATLTLWLVATTLIWGRANPPPSVLLYPSVHFQSAEAQIFLNDLGINPDNIHWVTAGHPREVRFIRIDAINAHQKAAISHSALFEKVEMDFWGELAGCSMVNDTGFASQWGLYNDGSFNNDSSLAGADIDACNAWSFTTGSSDIKVGFIDSGIRTSHPDLQGRIWENIHEIPGNGIDDDNNGYIDDIKGWNTANSTNQIHDPIGHGTLINGITGSNPNNNTGYVGVDWNCKLMNVNGFTSMGFGQASWWAEGVYYLVDQGVDVINMSLGIYHDVQALKGAIEYAEAQGVVVVAAVHNHNLDSITFPAKYPTVLAVGASDFWDQRMGGPPTSSFGSNYGPEIDVLAPGLNIYGINHLNTGSLSFHMDGTSMATSFVSGLASLLLSMDPHLSPSQVRDIIRNTAEDQVGRPNEDTPGFDYYHGYGRINAYEALRYLSNSISAEEPSSETIQIRVYPNPSFGKVTLQNELATGYYELYNTSGKLVFSGEIQHINTEIVLPSTKGLYFLKVKQERGAEVIKLVRE